MSDYPDGTLPITIEGITIAELPIDIVAQTIITLAIDIVAQSVGNLAVNIAASAVTLDINIASSAATIDINIASSAATLSVNIVAALAILNIKTAGGTNIIIDKLTQTAYTPRRPTISNDGGSILWTDISSANRIGKFFPRAMRGFIDEVTVHCKNTGGTASVYTIYFSPNPTVAPLFSVTLSVAAGATAAWRSVSVCRMWNYDSLFLSGVWSTTDGEFGYDIDTPYDTYYSTDSGTSWITTITRWWIQLAYAGQTIGDLPISGTITTVPMLEKGFLFVGVEEIDDSVDVAAGATTIHELFNPSLYEFGELLYLSCLLDNAPASAPSALKTVDISGSQRGLLRALSTGDTANFYELDTSDKRLFAFETENVEQTLEIKCVANAGSDTNFKIKGLIAKYVFVR